MIAALPAELGPFDRRWRGVDANHNHSPFRTR